MSWWEDATYLLSCSLICQEVVTTLFCHNYTNKTSVRHCYLCGKYSYTDKINGKKSWVHNKVFFFWNSHFDIFLFKVNIVSRCPQVLSHKGSLAKLYDICSPSYTISSVKLVRQYMNIQHSCTPSRFGECICQASWKENCCLFSNVSVLQFPGVGGCRGSGDCCVLFDSSLTCPNSIP